MPASETTETIEKSEKPDPLRFSFEHGGKKHTFPVPLFEAITVGFVRRHRRLNTTDFSFSAMEALAGESSAGLAVLDVIDNMTRAEFNSLSKQLDEQLGASQGE